MTGMASSGRVDHAARLVPTLVRTESAVVVVHDGDSEDAQRYRSALAGSISTFLDRMQRVALADEVAAVCALPAPALRELLAPPPAPWSAVTTGGARNTLLLLAMIRGDSWYVQVDDDVVWPPLALPRRGMSSLATLPALPDLGGWRPVHLDRLLASPVVAGSRLVAAGVLGSPVGDAQAWRTWTDGASPDAPVALACRPGRPSSSVPIGLVGTTFAVRVDEPLPPFLPWGRGQDTLFGYLLGRMGALEALLPWVVVHQRPDEHPIHAVRDGAGYVTEAIALLASQCPPERRRSLADLGDWLGGVVSDRSPMSLDAILREAWKRRWASEEERARLLPPHRRAAVLGALDRARADPVAHRPRELRALPDGALQLHAVVAAHARHCSTWAALFARRAALRSLCPMEAAP